MTFKLQIYIGFIIQIIRFLIITILYDNFLTKFEVEFLDILTMIKNTFEEKIILPRSPTLPNLHTRVRLMVPLPHDALQQLNHDHDDHFGQN